MYYILFYETVDNYIERRTPYRSAHLTLAQSAYEDGTLVMVGALADPADGAVLVFRADTPTVAEEFARKDPYVKNGLIKKWQNVVIGNKENQL
jgi:uncharacterized protein